MVSTLVTERPGFDSPVSRSASLVSAVSNWSTRQMPERFLVYRPQPTPVQFLKNKIPTHPHPQKKETLVLTNPYSRFPPTCSPPGHQGPFNEDHTGRVPL